MALINGFLSQAIVYASIVNPQLTSDFFNATEMPWPPSASLASTSYVEEIITNYPVSANGQMLNGQIAGAYSDDFYHRIHIIPARLDLGNIVSAQASEVRIWNAYFTSVTLDDITGLDDGIALAAQPEPPLIFLGLQERTWTVSITPDGPPVISATLVWQFENDDTATLIVTGNRMSAFTWMPDWTDGITEKLLWATDILQSRTGIEQRRALRLTPRREFEIDIYAEGRERQALDLALFGWSSRIWAMPVWPDVQLTTSPLSAGDSTISCSTTHRDFHAGGLVLLLGETAFQYEAAEILSLTSNSITLKRVLQNSWPVSTRLFPVRTARMQVAPRLTRLNDTLQQGQTISFTVMESCDWPAVMPVTTYRGWPVFDATPDETEDLTSQYNHLLLTLDNGSSHPLVTDTADLAFPVHVHRWMMFGADERATLRSIMYALNGRQKAVWIPTHADDMRVVAIITDTATTIDIAAIGYTRFAQLKPFRRDIRIELFNGTVYYRRITGSAEISESVERLQLNASFGVLINPGDIYQISWLMLMRADSDSIEIKHENDIDGVATASQVFKGVRDEL